jgi:hypothetical protein
MVASELPTLRVDEAPHALLVDIDAPRALDGALALERSLLARCVVLASPDTLFLSRAQALLARGPGAVLGLPVSNMALLVERLQLPTLADLVHEASTPPPPPSDSARAPNVRRDDVRVPGAPPSQPRMSVAVATISSTPAPPRQPTLPPLGARTTHSSLPPPVDAERPSRISAPPASGSAAGAHLSLALSPELAELLAQAEAKVPRELEDATAPTPFDEVMAILPDDVLLALDSAVDEDDDDEGRDGAFDGARGTRSGTHGGTHGGTQHRTHTEGSGGGSTGGGGTHAGGSPGERAQVTNSGLRTQGGSTGNVAGTSELRTGELRTGEAQAERETHGFVPSAPPGFEHGLHGAPPDSRRAPASVVPPSYEPAPRPATVPVPTRAPERPQQPEVPLSVPPLPAPGNPALVGLAGERDSAAREAAVFLSCGGLHALVGRAIRERDSCVLCIAESPTARTTRGHESARTYRIALFGGDVVSVVAGQDDESLLDFLVERGDILRAESPALRRKIPREGRYAAAALVAHGILQNDEIWDVLRAHAGWLLGRSLTVSEGVVEYRELDPDATRAPSVFGAQTGALVFVDAVRRNVLQDDVDAVLGGRDSHLMFGAGQSLLVECGFSDIEVSTLQTFGSLRLGEAAERLATPSGGNIAMPPDEVRPMLYALVSLGVFEVVRAEPARQDARRAGLTDALDDDARRARIRARVALVDEGDYFAVLGVSRDATGYEIRKAFVELRREFEPSRLLTSGLLTHRADVERIVVVLEEAYEVLREASRRERYRRAIQSAPQ